MFGFGLFSLRSWIVLIAIAALSVHMQHVIKVRRSLADSDSEGEEEEEEEEKGR